MTGCAFCRKLGLVACWCAVFGLAIAGPITDAKLMPSHSVVPLMRAVSATTSTTATMSGMSFIPDQVTGTVRIAVWQDKKGERAQAAAPSSYETDRAAQPPT